MAEEAPGGLGGLICEAKDEAVFPMRTDEQILRLECLVPDAPRLENRVTLGRGRDAQGLADVVIAYAPSPRDRARLEYAVHRAEDLLHAAGGTLLRREKSLWWMLEHAPPRDVPIGHRPAHERHLSERPHARRR